MAARIDQRSARSDRGSIVAGDQTNINNNTTVNVFDGPYRSPGIVEQLLAKLQAEMANSAEVRHTVESLKYFYEHRDVADGVIGLEEKLKAGGRASELYFALAKKEQFVKLLDRWSLYASAQEIFAYLLAAAEHHFSMRVHPQIGEMDQLKINQLIEDVIVTPTIAECGTSVFTLNHGLVMGMIYWLAEQCFVRWHT